MKQFYKKLSADTAGFGIVPVLLVVAVTGVVAFAGYAVYQAGQTGQSNSQLNQTGQGVLDDDGDLHIGNNTPIDGELIAASQVSALEELSKADQARVNAVGLERIGSDSRYLTAIEISKNRFPNSSPNGVVLVNGESYADAITGIGLSYTNTMLYVPPEVTHENELFKAVAEEIRRLGVNKITIVGGTAAITTYQVQVMEDLVNLPSSAFTRVPGDSRVETSISAAKKFYNFSGTVFIANGYKEADAALFQRGYEQGPMVFINEDGSMHPATLAYLREQNNLSKIVLLGSESAITAETRENLAQEFGNENIIRIAGSNRYHTATSVSQTRYGEDCDCTVYIVNAVAEADAIMANSLAAGSRGPVLYTDVNRIPLQTAYEIQRLNPKKIVVVGGEARVSEDTANLLRGVASGVIRVSELQHYERGPESSTQSSSANPNELRGTASYVIDNCEALGREAEYDSSTNEYYCD